MTLLPRSLFLQLIDDLLDMDIIESFQIWGQGDVFRKKAEGFQRYAAMKEFTNVMRQGERCVVNASRSP